MAIQIHTSVHPEGRNMPGLPKDCYANFTVRQTGRTFSVLVRKDGKLETHSYPNGLAVWDAEDAPDIAMALQAWLGLL